MRSKDIDPDRIYYYDDGFRPGKLKFVGGTTLYTTPREASGRAGHVIVAPEYYGRPQSPGRHDSYPAVGYLVAIGDMLDGDPKRDIPPAAVADAMKRGIQYSHENRPYRYDILTAMSRVKGPWEEAAAAAEAAKAAEAEAREREGLQNRQHNEPILAEVARLKAIGIRVRVTDPTGRAVEELSSLRAVKVELTPEEFVKLTALLE